MIFLCKRWFLDVGNFPFSILATFALVWLFYSYKVKIFVYESWFFDAGIPPFFRFSSNFCDVNTMILFVLYLPGWIRFQSHEPLHGIGRKLVRLMRISWGLVIVQSAVRLWGEFAQESETNRSLKMKFAASWLEDMVRVAVQNGWGIHLFDPL